MNHITDFQFNEYLDHALDKTTQEQFDLHLSSCTECRTRLEELIQLDSNLAGLHEMQLPRDLTSFVLARIPQSQPALWTRTFAAQLGAAFGMIFFLAVEIAKSIYIPSLSTFLSPIPYPRFPMFEFRFALPNFQFIISELPFPVPHSLFSSFYSLFAIPQLTINIPQLPTFQIPFSNIQASVIAIFTVVFGLIGNAVLLREHSEVRK